MAWQTIAIQEQLDSNMANWMAKVSDEQYPGNSQRNKSYG